MVEVEARAVVCIARKTRAVRASGAIDGQSAPVIKGQ